MGYKKTIDFKELKRVNLQSQMNKDELSIEVNHPVIVKKQEWRKGAFWDYYETVDQPLRLENLKVYKRRVMFLVKKLNWDVVMNIFSYVDSKDWHYALKLTLGDVSHVNNIQFYQTLNLKLMKFARYTERFGTIIERSIIDEIKEDVKNFEVEFKPLEVEGMYGRLSSLIQCILNPISLSVGEYSTQRVNPSWSDRFEISGKTLYYVPANSSLKLLVIPQIVDTESFTSIGNSLIDEILCSSRRLSDEALVDMVITFNDMIKSQIDSSSILDEGTMRSASMTIEEFGELNKSTEDRLSHITKKYGIYTAREIVSEYIKKAPPDNRFWEFYDAIRFIPVSMLHPECVKLRSDSARVVLTKWRVN
jgi:hypothetical protein